MPKATKPVIFFSHSSHDAAALARLKAMFIEKTGGTVDVFLSSDGQSIPLGRNWVSRVESALVSSRLMFVFLTPYSLLSKWIYFEAGFAYANDVQVVPVGFLGVDLSVVTPPLGLLQGFNIKNEDGLDNLITMINDLFEHKHTQRFNSDEYKSLVEIAEGAISSPLGKHGHLIEKIVVDLRFEGDGDPQNQTVEKLNWIESILRAESIACRRTYTNVLDAFGMSIVAFQEPGPRLKFTLDSSLIERTRPIVEKIAFDSRNTAGTRAAFWRFDFMSPVQHVVAMHKMTARLAEIDAAFGDGHWFCREGYEFYVEALQVPPQVTSHTFVGIRPLLNGPDLKTIGELFDLMFKHGVLYVDKTSPHEE